MKLLDRLERRLGRLAVPNLALLIAMGQGLVLVMNWLNASQPGAADVMQGWQLKGSEVLAGEWWRLLTFVFVPPGGGILFLFALYLFVVMGGALENQWGAFRFNVYMLVGCVASVAVAFIVPDQAVTVGYLGLSVVLAFACLFPDFRLYVMFVFPVPIKFLAWFVWFFYGVTLFSGMASVFDGDLGDELPSDTNWLDKLLVLSSILNFALFFGSDILSKIRSGQRRQQHRRQAEREEVTPFHTCSHCGLTEKDDSQMLFQFCSRCDGDHEYCQDHLRDHEHVVEEDGGLPGG